MTAEEELDELIRLSEQSERYDARRLAALIALHEVMQILGITTPAYA